MRIRFTLLLLLLLSLAACGFQLRGDSKLPAWLSPLYLQPGQLNSSQIAMAKASLKKASVELSEVADSSNRLSLQLSPLKSRKVAGSSLSTVELLQLTMSLEYGVEDSKGRVRIEKSKITQSMELELDSSNVLVHEQTIRENSSTLEQRLIQSMLFQLSH
ncbi:MAG: hypothetical protein H8D34_00695 [Chloroflexi bacterium]|nr:hypothetical protein [Chloroflexota bacterium]